MDETTEQVPAWADALGKRFDEACSTLSARMDALENKGGDGSANEEAMRKAEEERRKEEEAKRALEGAITAGGAEESAEAKAACEAKERSDAEEKARMDAAEAERKEKEEQMRKDSEEKMRADAQLRADNADMKKQIDAMNARLQALTTPLSASDRDQLSAAQARWDSVAQMFGDTVPAPLHGESPIAYRQRLAAKFQKHSEKFKGIRLDSLDGVVFDTVEEQIRMDAQAVARSPEVMPAGKLIPIVRNDEAGRQITEYSGDMDAWLGYFKHQGHGVRLLDPRQKH